MSVLMKEQLYHTYSGVGQGSVPTTEQLYHTCSGVGQGSVPTTMITLLLPL